MKVTQNVYVVKQKLHLEHIVQIAHSVKLAELLVQNTELIYIVEREPTVAQTQRAQLVELLATPTAPTFIAERGFTVAQTQRVQLVEWLVTPTALI